MSQRDAAGFFRHAVRADAIQVGLGIRPAHLVLREPRKIEQTDPFLDRSLWLLLHSDLRRTNRVRLLVDHLAKELTALRPKFLGPLA